MPTIDLQQELDIFDLVTDSMYTSYFLEVTTDLIKSEHANTVTAAELYSKWTKAIGGRVVPPHNLGSILATMYMGILLAKEAWFDLVPDTNTPEDYEHWGIHGASITPSAPTPSIRTIIRRIRNSLGHGNFRINTDNLTNYKLLLEETLITFDDANPRNAQDIFSITCPMIAIASMIKRFQDTARIDIYQRLGLEEDRLPGTLAEPKIP